MSKEEPIRDDEEADASVLIEVIFQDADLASNCEYDRHEIEDELEAVFDEKELGSVTGGGSGLGHVTIDVEVEDPKQLSKVIKLLRKILGRLNVPRSTVLHVCGDNEQELPAYP